jgi:hypothetical protein
MYFDSDVTVIVTDCREPYGWSRIVQFECCIDHAVRGVLLVRCVVEIEEVGIRAGLRLVRDIELVVTSLSSGS